jgi:microcystin degradation protein MlrC
MKTVLTLAASQVFLALLVMPAHAGDARKTVFVGGLAAEIHTGAPFYTRFEDFEETDLGPFEALATERDLELVMGTMKVSSPANRVLAPAWHRLRDELLDQLRAAMPVDLVVLGLHGAMAAQGQDDCEGELLRAVRDIVGPDVPIGAGLDAHAHLSREMVDAADILVFYKEWPHIDAIETIERAFRLTADVAEGRIEPRMSLYDTRMIGFFHTLEEPTKSLVDDMKAAEADDDVVVVNFIHGFPYGDVPDMGTKVLVITDDAQGKGDELAERFGRRVFDLRGKTAPRAHDLEDGLDAIAASTNHPAVVADYSDMPFGGAPSDGTFLLRGLIRHGVDNAIIAGLWDPMAIEVVSDLNPGDRIQLRIGGKTGPMSGDPLDTEVEVRWVGKDQYMKSSYEEMATAADGSPVGTIAIVRVPSGKAGYEQGIDVVLVEKRYPIYGYRALESLGLEPRNRRVIVVKSGNNFYDGYADIAGDVIYVMSPGLLGRVEDQDPRHIERPKWPFDEVAD